MLGKVCCGFRTDPIFYENANLYTMYESFINKILETFFLENMNSMHRNKYFSLQLHVDIQTYINIVKIKVNCSFCHIYVNFGHSKNVFKVFTTTRTG